MTTETARTVVRRRSLSRSAQHIAVLAGLLVVGLTAFSPALRVRPFYLDNVVSLTLAERGSPWRFWTHTFVTYQPTYRPFAFSVLWLQGQVSGLHASPYYLFNILTWVACAWVMYAIAHKLTASRAISGLVAFAVFVDPRATTLLWTIEERQMSLAMLAGLLALLLAIYLDTFRLHWAAAVAIGLLLLISDLSIEYGLAFSAAVLVAALIRNDPLRAPLFVAAIAAPLAYAGIRFALAGGAFHDYCENQGYFTGEWPDGVCLSSFSTVIRIKQHVYNVAASIVGIPFPTVFLSDGVLRPHAISKLLSGLVIFALALFGVMRRPRAAMPFIGLWIATAVLSFYIYRSRNQLIGVFGLAASAGIGLAELTPMIRGWPRRRYAAIAASAVALAWFAFSASRMTNDLNQIRARDQLLDPCKTLAQHPADVNLAVIESLKRSYGRRDPDCGRSATIR